MTKVTYKSSSPYSKTIQNSWYLSHWKPINIPAHETDLYIEIETVHEERPDQLAVELYGSSDYWWVFMRRNRNDFNHPIYDLKAGMRIWVPTRDRLLKLIG